MKIDSPCKLVCVYDEDKVCLGCHRTMDEIVDWVNYNDQQKLEVWKNIRMRKRALKR